MNTTRMLLDVVKTTVFLIALWGIVLFALPIGISIVETEVGLQRFPPEPLIAGPLLLLGTLLALWAAFTLVLSGQGTPLTVDPPRALVISGPYAYVRHPFVIGVVAQIVALGITIGSIPVMAYAAITMIVWYYGIRPREERTLEERFGPDARAYFQHVRGFRPRLTPYRSTRRT
jgi:protein-S-isoprenylcysteine O-methyltransferase Ste14